jgi:hypothetical protein
MHEQVAFGKWGRPRAKNSIVVHVWSGGHGVNAMHGATLGIVAALSGMVARKATCYGWPSRNTSLIGCPYAHGP